MPSNTFQRVVQLLGDAQTSFVAKEKLDCLSQVRELIFHREPSLLDNFLDEFMDFQHDKHAEVRRAVVEFIELACKHDNDHLRKGVERLYHIIQNDKEKLNVIKRVIGAHTVVYKLCLSWLAKSKGANKVIVDTFGIACKIKERILALLASDNEGLRAFVIKFIETVVLTQSRRRSDSEIPKPQEKDVSLDQIPVDHRTLNIKRLEDEGKRCFEELLNLAHSDTSSICLQVCMNALVNIALQRPQFMARAVASLETLHVNLPPQLATSQVTSVRKCLKQCLLSILRHPSSLDHQQQVATLLTDLGATQVEVLRAMPRLDEATRKRRQQEAAERLQQAAAAAADGAVSKRPRLDDDGAVASASGASSLALNSGGVAASSATSAAAVAAAAAAATADDFEDDEAGEVSELDRAAEKLVGRLTPANVSDLVLLSMVLLPDAIPPAFQSTYTPIAAAGTPAQIGHLARLLAAQLLAAGLAPDGSKLPTKRVAGAASAQQQVEESQAHQQQTAMTVKPETSAASSAAVPAVPAQASRPRQQFSLHKAVTPLTKETQAQLARMAFERLLNPAGHVTSHPGLSIVRQRLLSGLTAQFGGDLYQLLFDYVVEDVRRRWELLVMLLYHEYTRYLGYTVAQPSDGSSAVKLGSYESYDRLMSSLCNSLQLLPSSKELYFARLLAEAPLVTDSAFEQLRTHCMRQPDQGLRLLRDLALSRPQRRFLIALLQFAACGERPDLRAPALDIVKELYIDDRHDEIRDFALQRLEILVTAFGDASSAGGAAITAASDGIDDVNNKDAAAAEDVGSVTAVPPPPAELFCLPGQAQSTVWTDDARASCLHLTLGLLPLEHSLLRQLASAFARLKEPQSKRLLLRLLEGPAASLGQASLELLRLVRGDCPDGAEPMLVRLVQLLASAGKPDPGLVDAVRQSRSRGGGDARLLVAVLPGMTNEEILAALPRVLAAPDKLARLGLQRLLADGPLPPEDLLVAVHEAEFSPPVQLRQCLQASQQIFASTTPALNLDSFASALKRLADPTNRRLPTLLFRTMMQAHSIFPRLAPLVLTLLPGLASHPAVLHRDYPALWEGFVRCCARLKPAGYGVLLTCLPSDRLADSFRILPELRQALTRYAANLAPQQRAALAPAVLALLTPASQQPTPPIEVAAAPAVPATDRLAADRERLRAK